MSQSKVTAYAIGNDLIGRVYLANQVVLEYENVKDIQDLIARHKAAYDI